MTTDRADKLHGFTVEIEVDEGGVYIAECIDLPGCVSDGETEEKARDNIADAIEGYLVSMEKCD